MKRLRKGLFAGTMRNFPVVLSVVIFPPLTGSAPYSLRELFPYSHLIVRRLRGVGYDCRELPPTDMASLQQGRHGTRSKEYITFTALLGDVCKCVAETPEPHQFIVPHNGGAEADGQFSRVIRCRLDAMGRRDVMLYSPLLEELHRDRHLWYDMLAADVVMCATAAETANTTCLCYVANSPYLWRK